MSWLMILAFAVSSNIDNLGVGISYGVQNIKIRWGKNILIASICFLMSMGGITFGVWMASIIPGMLPSTIGAVLLLLIGIRVITLAKPKKQKNTEGSGGNYHEILRNPEEADVDQSGHIGWVEAIFLGIALSANALTNGLGAGLIGLSPLAISITAAIGSLVCLWAGVKVGTKVAHVQIGSFTVGQFGTVLSGLIIILIAVKVFFLG